MAHPVEKVLVGFVVATAAAAVAFPARVGSALAPGGSAVVAAIMWADANLPEAGFVLALFLGVTVVTVLLAVEFGRVGYALLREAGPRTRRAWNFLTPSTPIGKMGVALCLTVLFLIGSAWALPYVIGDLSEGTVSGAGTFANDSDEPRDERADDNGTAPLARDVTTHGDPGADERAYDRPGPDADGDRLPDEWELAGQTPDGAWLPGADPTQRDLYVQVDYGGGTYPLTDEEKRALKQVWADMPVENPDGSEGIALHVDDDPSDGYGGAIGTQVSITGTDPGEVHQYYTPENLGPRRCVYHQVVVGEGDGDDRTGYASAPGFAAVLDHERPDYDGDVPVRAHVLTHQLLHNVAGEVDGELHTEGGWLAPSLSPENTQLAGATQAELGDGFAGSAFYQDERC